MSATDPARSAADRRAPMRIALASDWFLPRLGGIETQLAGLARGLAARGHEARVVTTTRGPEDVDGVPVRRLAVRLAPKFGFAVGPDLVRVLRREFEQGAYDVVHVHMSIVSPVAYAAVLAAHTLRLPTVVTFHSVLLTKPYILRLVDAATRWTRWPIVLTAVSELVAAQVRRTARGLDVGILPNGVDCAGWATARASDRTAGEIVAVSTLRLNRRKRPLALLRAFERARSDAEKAGRNLVLYIAGDGGERARMERFIADRGLGARIFLLGARSQADLRRLYSESDFFVLPSIRESFGIAALEARCAGLPVIAMKAAGAAEFICHEKTGLLAANDRELARDIARLALEDGLRARLAPPEPELSRFAWPAVIDGHLACYEKARQQIAESRSKAAS